MRIVRLSALVLGPVLLAAQSPQSLESAWRLEATVPIQPDLHHVQGVDVEDGTVWISSVHARAGRGFLTRLELATGKLISQVQVQDRKRIHPGGIALDGDAIWIPVAEYHRGGPSWIERRDKKTLKLLDRFEVADHIGCVAASKDELVGGSWGSRTVYRWTKQGRELSRTPNPIRTEWQDIKFDGSLLLGSGSTSKTAGSIEWVSLPSMTIERSITTGVTDRGLTYTHEGMTLRNGMLYLLPEDAPSRLFVFAPSR